MAITCSSYGQNISGSNLLVCGYIVRINNINPSYQDIELLFDNSQFVTVSVGYNSMQYNNKILTFHLVSKNESNNTAVIDFVESDNPCNGITCSNICIGNDLYSQQCDITYDSQNVPIGYTCKQNTLIQQNSSSCSHKECVGGTCTQVTGAGTNTCNTIGSTTECNVSYTHTFEIELKPYSWYTPQSASDWIITNLVGLNGKITNFVSSITGWQYVKTDIFNNGNNVLIQIRLNNVSGQSLVSPQVVQIPWTFLLVVTVGAFVIYVGIPIAVRVVETVSNILQQGTTYTPEEVVILVNNNIVPSQITECETNNLPSNPVGYATCVKSVVCGAQNGLTDALSLQKYGVDCMTLNTNQDFDQCTLQYNIDGNLSNLQSCINNVATKNNPKVQDAAIQKQLEGCIVRIPFTNSCILYDKDLLLFGTVGIVLAGGYIVYTNNTSKSDTSKKK